MKLRLRIFFCRLSISVDSSNPSRSEPTYTGTCSLRWCCVDAS